MLNALWFIQPSPDFEREHWTLLAYVRDAETDLKCKSLTPFYQDIKRRIQDLECFLTTRYPVSEMTDAEELNLSIFNKRSDDSEENKEVFKIVKWALEKLQELYKQYNIVWRTVESSFNMYYIGDKPDFDVRRGVMMIRYAGSPITEVYKFWEENGKALMSHLEYVEEEYAEIKQRLQKVYTDDTEVFIIAESLVSFNTKTTSMPFLADTLEKKVMNTATKKLSK